MTNEQKIKIKQLRLEGMGYTTVAKTLGLSKETVKSFCRRNGLAGRADLVIWLKWFFMKETVRKV